MYKTSNFFGFQFPQLGLELLRQRAGELHQFPGAGVEEPQAHGVEALALKAGDRLFCAVNRVPQDGVADVGHVDTNLMSTAGLQAALHIGEAPEPFQYGPVGNGGAAARHHRHLLPVHRVAADGSVHGTAVLPEVSNDDAAVDPGQGVVLELGGQLLVSEVVFRRDDEAGGVPVDAVDDAGPQLSADTGEAVPAVVEQGVHQSTVGMTGGRVDYQPLGLVHHNDVTVLVDHIQGDVLGRHVHRFRVRQGDLHRLTAPELIVLGQGLPGAGDPALLQQPRRGGAGHVLQV